MRKALVAIGLALCLVPAAVATDVDRVRVGGTGSTRGFSQQTFVVVSTPDAYARIGFDGDAGSWSGPLCVVSSNSSLSAVVTLPWTVAFSRTYRSADEAADRGRTFRDLPVLTRGTIEISHRIRGKEVGGILASYVVGQSRQDHGWAELGLGIPLTRGVFVAARFWSTGPSFACNVGGTASRQWHVDAVQAAAARVVVDGNLPAARVTARAQRRRVVGFVNDGLGHPLVGVRVTLERRAGRAWRRAASVSTNASGLYSVLARPGRVRVAVESIRSRTVRVR